VAPGKCSAGQKIFFSNTNILQRHRGRTGQPDKHFDAFEKRRSMGAQVPAGKRILRVGPNLARSGEIIVPVNIGGAIFRLQRTDCGMSGFGGQRRISGWLTGGGMRDTGGGKKHEDTQETDGNAFDGYQSRFHCSHAPIAVDDATPVSA
jgi:hypothetical protein